MTSMYTVEADEWAGLSKLVEEMGELQQVLGKIMANHGKPIYEWGGEDLRPRLTEELGDVIAALRFFAEHNLNEEGIIDRADYKYSLYKKWRADLRGD